MDSPKTQYKLTSPSSPLAFYYLNAVTKNSFLYIQTHSFPTSLILFFTFKLIPSLPPSSSLPSSISLSFPLSLSHSFYPPYPLSKSVCESLKFISMILFSLSFMLNMSSNKSPHLRGRQSQPCKQTSKFLKLPPFSNFRGTFILILPPRYFIIMYLNKLNQ